MDHRRPLDLARGSVVLVFTFACNDRGLGQRVLDPPPASRSQRFQNFEYCGGSLHRGIFHLGLVGNRGSDGFDRNYVTTFVDAAAVAGDSLFRDWHGACDRFGFELAAMVSAWGLKFAIPPLFRDNFFLMKKWFVAGWAAFILTITIFVPLSGRADGPPPPSLTDLGFNAADTTANSALQAQLERRTSMLKTHQTLGLITLVPMAAAILTSTKAGDSHGWRNLHMAMGITTAAFYFTTASFAIFAPKPEGTKSHGLTKIHKTLAFIHFPAMIMTPILGYLAKRQEDRGEKLHGIAQYHNVAAYTLGISFAAAMAVMTFNF